MSSNTYTAARLREGVQGAQRAQELYGKVEVGPAGLIPEASLLNLAAALAHVISALDALATVEGSIRGAITGAVRRSEYAAQVSDEE